MIDSSASRSATTASPPAKWLVDLTPHGDHDDDVTYAEQRERNGVRTPVAIAPIPPSSWRDVHNTRVGVCTVVCDDRPAESGHDQRCPFGPGRVSGRPA